MLSKEAERLFWWNAEVMESDITEKSMYKKMHTIKSEVMHIVKEEFDKE